MKIGKQLPAVSPASPQERRQVLVPEAPVTSRRAAASESAIAEAGQRKSTSFSLQLNQQLSSMQTAESYLADLHNRLSQLKLSLSRELGAPSQAAGQDAIREQFQQVDELLQQRSRRSGNTLDANLKLRLNEPVRSRFSLQGLDSLDTIRQSGRETLLFSGGRQLAEPVAVVLDDNLSDEQILRRFNATLGNTGIRAELDQHGQLKFSARESDWQQLKGQLAVQGEGKLFAKGAQRLASEEERALSLPAEPQLDSLRELRRLLDSVVSGLDKVTALREQLSQRQREIREFLARQADADEQQWALEFARELYELMQRSPSSYAAVTQTVVAQANIGRFAVVSLLSA
ncbi:Flagellar hook-associated protein OS=Stutzerimonas stutzeri OX=316 GN=CXK94_02075 PE=4 SV=1 [Stutzerimonas stutzeri]